MTPSTRPRSPCDRGPRAGMCSGRGREVLPRPRANTRSPVTSRARGVEERGSSGPVRPCTASGTARPGRLGGAPGTSCSQPSSGRPTVEPLVDAAAAPVLGASPASEPTSSTSARSHSKLCRSRLPPLVRRPVPLDVAPLAVELPSFQRVRNHRSRACGCSVRGGLGPAPPSPRVRDAIHPGPAEPAGGGAWRGASRRSWRYRER